jgi:hypothetical protein
MAPFLHLALWNANGLPNYVVYRFNHPNGTARGGSTMIIKRSIKHHPLNGHTQDFLQATRVSVEDSTGPLTVSPAYLPSKHCQTSPTSSFL